MEYLTTLLNFVKENKNKLGKLKSNKFPNEFKNLDEIDEKMENSQNIQNLSVPKAQGFQDQKNFLDFNLSNLNQNLKQNLQQNLQINQIENPTNSNTYNSVVKQIALQILNNSNTNTSSNNIQSNMGNSLKIANLINELINLERENRLQIELIERILQNKYNNISHVNNILEGFLSKNLGGQTQNLNNLQQNNHKDSTKSCSKSNEKNLNLLSNLNLSPFENLGLRGNSLVNSLGNLGSIGFNRDLIEANNANNNKNFNNSNNNLDGDLRENNLKIDLDFLKKEEKDEEENISLCKGFFVFFI